MSISQKYYTGIGSRSVSDMVGRTMASLAKTLNVMGYCLRSGCAQGSDQWFQKGVGEQPEAQIWLPWENFNQDFQEQFPDHDYRLVDDDDSDARNSVNKFHSNPEKLSVAGRLLMCRNFRQVKGLGQPDSEFVICWTPDGKDSGGTGFAIRVATHWKIPVYNLHGMTSEEVLMEIEKRNIVF